MFNKKLLLTPLALFCLAGCSFKPVTPLKDTSYTSTYDEANINALWWKEFNDPVLNDLIGSALKYNSDLALALNNIETARVNLGLSKIEYLPNVNYQGKASRGAPSGDLNSYASYSASAVLNYELDLWGKVRNSVKAKNSLFKATKYDYEAARLSIASSVANSYFKLLFLKEQESVLRDTLKSYEDTFKFRQNQFSVGAISSITLYQAKTQVDSAKVKLTNVINELSNTNTALAILTGKSYDDILYKDIITDKIHQPTPPEVPNGVPSDLLLRRADVAASLERLKATNFLVGVARANYFPSFSLTGMFGYTSMEFDRLFIENANSWSAGGSLVGPLLDFGRSAKRVEIANLEQNASFINYDKTLKEAFGEVRNALVNRENAISKQTDMANLLNSQEKLYNIANERFKTGYSDNLELLDAQRGYLSARLEYAASNLEVSNSVVEVFKALGGGFKVEDNKIKQMLESNATIIPTSSVNPFKDLN